MRHHHVDVTGAKGIYNYVVCFTCGMRERYATRARAQEAADSHRLFTHVTGGRRCGERGCRADRTIARLTRMAAGLT